MRDTGRIALPDSDVRFVFVPIERTSWQGRAAARDLSLDSLQIDPLVFGRGLLTDEEHARRVSSALLAGAPDEEPLRVIWNHDADDGAIVIVATNCRETQDAVEIERRFSQRGDGAWDVEHAYFAISSRYQGGGGARRMLRASLEVYDRLDIVRIDVHANLTVGGYAWARLGFVVNDARHVRAALAAAFSDEPASPLLGAAQRAACASSDEDLMYNLASLTGADGTPHGKRLLAGSGWYGHLDLTNPRHRERLARSFDE
ncbi:hypothetical protein SQ03_25650 [Methylobacterium platani JCM 14648]|uniref:Uncharacterized protein n=2 Tax=Methylobacterium platani TaxID=427683 RepID=A0A179S9Q9_9HYPH|nr:hypothetical protein SQ03_25650 [Methylobacterium platani JCM 14648]OAS23357.1 hypothetical protein A5481_16965 [Methylobacterium platani]